MPDKPTYEEADFPLQSPRHTAFKTAFIYASISVLWILFSDQLLSIFVKNIETITRMQMIKGWFFVLATSYLIFLILQKDIKKYCQVEEALRHSQRQLQFLMDALPIALSWADEQGNIQYSNNKFRELFGYTLEDMPTVERWFQLAYPDQQYRQTVVSNWQIAVENARNSGPDVAPIEVTIACKDGSTRYVAVMGTLIQDWILAVFNDLTEKKLAEERLQRSEHRYRSLFENTGTATFLVEEDMTISQINAKCEELIGYPKDEIEGKMKTSDFVSVEDLERIKEYHFGRREDLDIYPSEYELELVDKHGNTKNAIIQVGMIPETKQSIASMIDITPLKRAEEELRKNEERFRTLVANIPGAVYRCDRDPDWTMHFLSDAIADICGYPASDFIGNNVRTYASVIHPDDRAMVEKDVEKNLEDGEPFTVEYRLQDAEGNVRWVYERGIGVRGEYGETQYLDGAIFDITERKHATKALEKSEANFRSLVEFSPAAVSILKGNQLIYVNPAWQQMTGYSEKEARRLDPFLIVHSEMREEIKQRALARSRGEQVPSRYEFKGITKNGEMKWADFSAVAIEYDNGPVILTVGVDITDRKLAEEALQETEKKLEAIINHHFQLTGMLDVQGRVIMANETALKYFNVAESEVQGKLFWETPWWSHSKEEQDKLQKAIQIAGKGEFVRYETSHLTSNGDLRVMDFSINPVIDGEGDVKYLIPEGRDITELKEAEESLRQSESQLRSLATRLQEIEETARKALARELHDQVGQGLTALSINLNILRNRLPPDTLKQLEERLEDSIEIVEETTETIRDVMAELRPSVLDDYGLTAALRWYGQRFSDRTGIAIKLKMEEISSRLAEKEESALFRITQEALTNVAKHANASELVLSFEESDGLFRLIIADNGKGFDYSAFGRPGIRTGWGILNMQERIQVLGGQFQIDSEPGKGASVIIEIRK
jgi:PAS domain S-box-containing protein